MPSYSGAWKRGAVQDTQAEPLGHPEYGAQHMHPGVDEAAGSRAPYAAPRKWAQTPPGLTDTGQSYDGVLTDQVAPGTLDGDPLTHDDGEPMPYGAGRSYAGNRAAANRARSVDRSAGGSRIRRPLESDDGTRSGSESHGGTTLDVGTVRALRGDNSLAENNPDGDGAGGPQRSGTRVQRWYTRRIQQRGQFRHDLRPARGRLAGQAVNSPGLAISNRNTSPYGTLDSSRVRTQSAPMLRRTPRPWTEDVTSDGGPDPTSAAGQGLRGWGL